MSRWAERSTVGRAYLADYSHRWPPRAWGALATLPAAMLVQEFQHGLATEFGVAADFRDLRVTARARPDGVVIRVRWRPEVNRVVFLSHPERVRMTEDVVQVDPLSGVVRIGGDVATILRTGIDPEPAPVRVHGWDARRRAWVVGP